MSVLILVLFFKQKTAYEMRISDWSSDVCSSDLARSLQAVNNQIRQIENQAQSLINQAKNLTSLPVSTLSTLQQQVQQTRQLLGSAQRIAYNVQDTIGRASCRERVCLDV